MTLIILRARGLMASALLSVAIASTGSALPCRTTHPTLCGAATRRTALLSTAAALAVTRPLPALAADGGSWAVHKGAFEASFFDDFKVSKASPEFLYKFVEEGTGEGPVNFQSVTMHYTGYLLDGTKFDSSYGGDPFKFRVGKGKVRHASLLFLGARQLRPSD